MKEIFILSICGLAAISSVQSRIIAQQNEHSRMTKQGRINLEECAREYNADVRLFDKPFEFEEQMKNTTIETCVLICGMKKKWNHQNIPLYEIISKWIKSVYDDGFHSPRFSREDTELKVKQCYIQEPNECEFIKCIGIGKPPISEIIGHVILKIASLMGEGIAKALGNIKLPP